MKALKLTAVIYALSFAFYALFAALGLWQRYFSVFAMIYMLMPLLGSILAAKLLFKEKIATVFLRFKFNWWLVAPYLVIPLVVAFTLLFNALMPGAAFDSSMSGYLATLPPEMQQLAAAQISAMPFPVMALVSLLSAWVAGTTINALFAFGEEFAWRNSLVLALREWRFAPAALFTGIVWGLWHAPLILFHGYNYPESRILGAFVLMPLMCVGLSFIMLYVTFKAKNVYVAAVAHGIFNGLAGYTVLYISGGNDILNKVTGISGILALLVVSAGFLAYDILSKNRIFFKKIGEMILK